MTTTRKDGRTDGRLARRVLCLCCANILFSLSLSCVRVCARARVVALKPTDASNGRSNGAGVYPRASEDAACEDACGRSRERRARARSKPRRETRALKRSGIARDGRDGRRIVERGR